MNVDKTIENKLNFELKVVVAAKRFFFSRKNLVAYSKTVYSKRKYLVRSLDIHLYLSYWQTILL